MDKRRTIREVEERQQIRAIEIESIEIKSSENNIREGTKKI